MVGNVAALAAYVLSVYIAGVIYGHMLAAPLVAAPMLLLLSHGRLGWSRLLNDRSRYFLPTLGLVAVWSSTAVQDIVGLARSTPTGACHSATRGRSDLANSLGLAAAATRHALLTRARAQCMGPGRRWRPA